MGQVFNAVARGSAALTLARLLTKTISFVAFYLVTVTLSLADYGLVTLALSVSGPVLVIAGLGQDDLVSANGARRIGEGREQSATALFGGFAAVKIVITAIILFLLVFVKPLLGAGYAEIINKFFLPLLIWIAATALRTLSDIAIFMRQRFVRFAAANVVEAAVKLVVVVVLYALGALSVTTVIWAYVIGKVIALFVTLPAAGLLLPAAGEFFAAVREFFAMLAARGKWDALRGFFGQLFAGVNNWILALFLGLEAVAVFNVAAAMNSLLQQLLPFRQVLFPIVARLSAAGGAGSFVTRRMVKYTVWINTVIILAAVIVLPPAVRLYYPKYAAALPIFFLLAPSLYINALSLSHAPLLQALGEQKLLLWLSLFGTISGLTVLPLSVWLLGVPGVVLEQLFSTGVIVGVRERRLRRVHQQPTFEFRDLAVFDAFDRTLVGRFIAAVRGRSGFWPAGGPARPGGDQAPPGSAR